MGNSALHWVCLGGRHGVCAPPRQSTAWSTRTTTGKFWVSGAWPRHRCIIVPVARRGVRRRGGKCHGHFLPFHLFLRVRNDRAGMDRRAPRHVPVQCERSRRTVTAHQSPEFRRRSRAGLNRPSRPVDPLPLSGYSHSRLCVATKIVNLPGFCRNRLRAVVHHRAVRNGRRR